MQENGPGGCTLPLVHFMASMCTFKLPSSLDEFPACDSPSGSKPGNPGTPRSKVSWKHGSRDEIQRTWLLLQYHWGREEALDANESGVERYCEVTPPPEQKYS